MPKLLNILAHEPTFSGADSFHWPMQEGTGTTTAEVINSNEATLESGTSWSTAGPNGRACISFDGISGRLTDSGFTIQMGAYSLSMAFWVYANFDTRQYISSDNDRSNTGYRTNFFDGEWNFNITDSDSGAFFKNAHGMSNDTWYHVAYTMDRATPSTSVCKFYRNGVYVNSHTLDSSSVDDMSGDSTWNIGAFESVSPSIFFSGKMCDFWTFRDKVLTANEVLELYKYLGD